MVFKKQLPENHGYSFKLTAIQIQVLDVYAEKRGHPSRSAALREILDQLIGVLNIKQEITNAD